MRDVAFIVAVAALAPFPTYAQNQQFSDCRTLEVAGNFVGSDETLVNGLVCKVGKPKTNSTASTQVATKTTGRSAALLGIVEPKILRSQEKAEASPVGANPTPAVTPRAASTDSMAAGAPQASSSVPRQRLGEIARAYRKEAADRITTKPEESDVKPAEPGNEVQRGATPAAAARTTNHAVITVPKAQSSQQTAGARPATGEPTRESSAAIEKDSPAPVVTSASPVEVQARAQTPILASTQEMLPREQTATSLASRASSATGDAQEPQTERPRMVGSSVVPQPMAANPPTQAAASATEEDAAFREGQGPTCHKNVSLGSMDKDKLFLAIPEWASEWYEKNQKRFPGICFSDSLMPGAHNYLVVFHTEAQQDPAAESLTKVAAQRETLPVSGVGGFTTSYGSTWHYAYEQTVATTITSVSAEKAPHNQPLALLSATAYSEQGIPISQQRPASAPKRDKETSPKSRKGQNLPLPEFRAEADLLNRIVEDIAKQ
jgi:hypothetical protein